MHSRGKDCVNCGLGLLEVLVAKVVKQTVVVGVLNIESVAFLI